MNNTKFETGATTHAVNELILFTDTTRELAELRDCIYADAADCGDKVGNPDWFQPLLDKSRARYCNEMGGNNSSHIIYMKDEEKEDYKKQYAIGFGNWKSEHGYK